MKTQLRNSLLACVSLFALGCAGRSIITSTLRKGYANKLDRIYILLSSNDSSLKGFYNALGTNLEISLKQRSISSKIHVYDVMGLDESKGIRNEIDTFNPTHILTVNQTGKVSTSWQQGGASDVGATFELLLREPRNDDVQWKAVLSTSAAQSTPFTPKGNIGSPELAAGRIIQSLENDGLIVPIKH